MAQVIAIQERLVRQRPRTAQSTDTGGAAILLFTGIRYERFDDYMTACGDTSNKTLGKCADKHDKASK